jgi:hypothetical protein
MWKMLSSASELLSMDEPRKRFAERMSSLDIHYDLGLGPGEPGGPGDFDITPWAHRVMSVDAKYAGNWELPVLGQVAAPTAVLIRPDGYVAWVGEGTDTGLRDALTTWFGSP